PRLPRFSYPDPGLVGTKPENGTGTIGAGLALFGPPLGFVAVGLGVGVGVGAMGVGVTLGLVGVALVGVGVALGTLGVGVGVGPAVGLFGGGAGVGEGCGVGPADGVGGVPGDDGPAGPLGGVWLPPLGEVGTLGVGTLGVGTLGACVGIRITSPGRMKSGSQPPCRLRSKCRIPSSRFGSN